MTLAMAAQKLCKSKNFNPQDINETLAVLSHGSGPDICFGHANAVSYLAKGVASDLRVGFSTTEDGSYAFTSYPSDPHFPQQEQSIPISLTLSQPNGHTGNGPGVVSSD
jgi:hypothetical protein